MNKNELIAAVAGQAGLSKEQAGAAVDATIDTISSTLKGGGEVRLVGFGNFSVSQRKATTGPQPADRRFDPDPGHQHSEIQARQRPEGYRQLLEQFQQKLQTFALVKLRQNRQIERIWQFRLCRMRSRSRSSRNAYNPALAAMRGFSLSSWA